MPLTFSTVEDAFIYVNMQAPFINSAFLNTETGESYFASAMFGGDEVPDDLDENDCYVALPHKNDLDLGVRLVEAFVSEYKPEEFDEVLYLFRRRGAYGRYKAWLESEGLLAEWHEFEEQSTQQALRQWCEENSIVLLD